MQLNERPLLAQSGRSGSFFLPHLQDVSVASRCYRPRHGFALGCIMSKESDLRLLDRRIEAHAERIDQLQSARAAMDSFGVWALDQEIARHQRWRSVQARLRDLLIASGQRKH